VARIIETMAREIKVKFGNRTPVFGIPEEVLGLITGIEVGVSK